MGPERIATDDSKYSIYFAAVGDAPAGSSCQANEFTCSLSRACVPLAFLCNGVGECPNGEDESRCG